MHAHYKEAWYYDPVSTHPKKNEPKQQNLIINKIIEIFYPKL